MPAVPFKANAKCRHHVPKQKRRLTNWPAFCCIRVLPVQARRNRGKTRRRQATQVRRDQAFKGRQFTAEVILRAVRWYLMFPIS
jgi:hypothetical protein